MGSSLQATALTLHKILVSAALIKSFNNQLLIIPKLEFVATMKPLIKTRIKIFLQKI